MMDAETKRQALGRLRRILGQIQGVQRMVEEEKYCVDILLQISAVQGALEQVSKILMTRHIETCVQDSLRAGSERERSQKIDELVRVFTRHSGLAGR
jgi:DNA-binding FrmR family transcriptional regulator